MKALTICQPYPYLILLPTTDPRCKRVENRRWPLRYRGDLAIHAGKSRAWLDESLLERLDIDERDLAFGAIVGVTRVVCCLEVEQIRTLRGTSMEWLRTHQHVHGPYCIVLDRVRRLKQPIPWRGAQGPFDVPDDVIAAAELVEVD